MTDAELVALSALIGGLFLLAGVFVGGWLTEHWAAHREKREEDRRNTRAAADRARADHLEMIDQTRREMSAVLTRLIALVAGDRNASSIPVGPHIHPRFNPNLVHDVDVVRLYTALATDFVKRQPGSGVKPADLDRVATVQTAIGRILDAQRRRALADEPLLEVDQAELRKHPELARAYATMLSEQPAGPPVQGSDGQEATQRD